MRYLIINPDHEPFLTNWFDYPNFFVMGMTVFDLHDYTYTTDGDNWKDITEDHL